MIKNLISSFQNFYLSRCWEEKNIFQSFFKKTAFFITGRSYFRQTLFNYFFKKDQFYQKLIKKNITRNLYFELTNRCNAACVFCPYPEMERPYKSMSMELFENTIDQYIEMGGKSVGFTPIVGDPMLDKFFFERLEYLENKNEITDVGFYTNGIALVPKKIDKLLVERNFNLNINMSFGGYDSDSYFKVMGVDMFKVVKKNIIYLLEQFQKLNTRNIKIKIDYRYPEEHRGDELSKLLEHCIQKNIISSDTLDGIFDTFGGNINQNQLDKAGMDFKIHYGHPKVGPCAVLFWKPIVLADGKINACAERDLETELIVGDLEKQNLKDIIFGKKMVSLIKSFYNLKNLPKVCSKCTVYQSIYNPKSKVWSNSLNWKQS